MALFSMASYLAAIDQRDTTWPHHAAGEKKRKRKFKLRGQKRAKTRKR